MTPTSQGVCCETTAQSFDGLCVQYCTGHGYSSAVSVLIALSILNSAVLPDFLLIASTRKVMR